MTNQKILIAFGIIAVLILSALSIEAANYSTPAKYKGLKRGANKADLFKPKLGPCQQLFPKKCSAWATVVGDKNTGKAYNCACRVPSEVTESNAVCFTSPANAKRAKPGYRVESCRR